MAGLSFAVERPLFGHIFEKLFKRENKIKDLKTNVANLKDQTQKLITNHNSKIKETEACKNMEIGNLRLMCGDLGKVRILFAVVSYQGSPRTIC